MERRRKTASIDLFNVAASQYGFFTTKQAEAAGFSRKTHLYHTRSGNWIRECRGIYRLAQFPPTERPDLILWSLWSRNRNEVPQGVYSHETALTLYQLSDVMPAKLHMTVPKRFRRNTPIPKALLLHRSDLPPTDEETVQGVQVTTPLRTILDLLCEGRLSEDFLVQAVREARRRGLITQKQIQQAALPKDLDRELRELLARAA